MTIDRYADAVDGLAPDAGEVETAELAVTDDVLVKAFALGPGATVEPHEHGDATNVFHVLEGEPTLIRGDNEESLAAPAVVLNERARNRPRRSERHRRARRHHRQPLPAPDGRRDRPRRAGGAARRRGRPRPSTQTTPTSGSSTSAIAARSTAGTFPTASAFPSRS